MKFWWLGALIAALPLMSSTRPNAAQAPTGGPALSLDDAIHIAEQNAFTLKTAASNVEIAHQQVVAARGQLGPQLSASASYYYLVNAGASSSLLGLSATSPQATGTTTGTSAGTTATTGTTAGTTATTGTTATAGTTGTTATTGFTSGTTGLTSGLTGGLTGTGVVSGNTQELSVTASLPIDISGTIHAGVKAAQASYRASRSNFAAADNDLRLSVRQAYFQILQDKAQIDVAQETVGNAGQTLTNAQQKLAAGTLARFDVLQYETQLSQAQSDLITAQNNLAVAKENFNNVLARPIDTPFDVQEVATLPAVDQSPQTLIQTAIANRPDVQAIEHNIESLSYNRKATEASMDPSLSVGASHFRLYEPGTFSTEAYETLAFVNLNLPIFDSGITRAHVREVRQQEEQAKIQLQQVELGIALEVRQDLSNLESAKAKLDVAQKQVDQAAEQYRLAVVRANAGEGITLDVTNAQTQLTTARTGLVNARYAYLIDYASLQRAIDEDGAKVPPIVPPRAK